MRLESAMAKARGKREEGRGKNRETREGRAKKRVKGIFMLCFAFSSFFLLPSSVSLSPSSAHAEDYTSAEEKAKELHRLASSDVIYQDQQIKAIYYQNVQMIELLKQIRDLLEQNLKEKQEE